MSERKELGKIQSVTVGYGGYQDAQFGVWLTLGGDSWGVSDGRGPWATWEEHCKWTVEDQSRQWGETMAYMRDLCKAAKIDHVHDLHGKPVEVTFDGMALKSWRILGEVL